MSTGGRKIVAIASGKGGTGKTTIAAHLAIMAARTEKTVLLDLDVEAPDVLGYFRNARNHDRARSVHVLVPSLVEPKCTGCGLCASACRFGAIVVIGGVVTIDQNICKGCGRCVSICPTSALVEEAVIVGETSIHEAASLLIFEGCMAIGDIRSTAVIEAAKMQAAAIDGISLELRDCPPGVSCPATHSIEGASYVVLIAEPTEFSIHDLEAAIQLTRNRNIPTGVVINKEGFGTADVEGFCKREGIPVIGRIAFNQDRAIRGAGATLWSGDKIVELEMARILGQVSQETTTASATTTGTSQ
ncbi:MAG: 4Fe-4S binding protein [Spirochaetota bacterium]